MSIEHFLLSYFDELNEELEGGTFGSKYRCKLNRKDYFVKVREAGNGWKSWGLRKEYNVCNSIDVNDINPKSHMLLEDDEYIAVAFDFVGGNNTLTSSHG